MKRNSLTTAVIAGIAGVAGIASLANAVELNPDGLGQVLVYPYYTVNAGQSTLLSVVNTTDEGKAVKVRFLEGYNSREVLDFNLFLSAFDVWTGVVFTQSDSDAGNLTTTDNTCTAPGIKGNASLPTVGTLHYVPFRNYQFAGTNTDKGPQGLDRTREGHIELIEMGAIQTNSALYAKIKHDDVTGVPPGCASVANLKPTDALANDIGHTIHSTRVNTGGLFGAGSIVNPAVGTIAGYNADAVDGFYSLDETSTTAVSPLFSGTSSTSPSLADTRTTPASAVAFTFTTESSGGAPGGSLRTLTYPLAQAVDAVSAVFQAATISNEYVVEDSAGSESDWIVTFPTKRFYVDRLIVGNTPIQPFEEVFAGQSCVEVGISYWDREERVPASSPGDFSPPPPDRPPSSLCYEAQAVTFQKAADYNADDGVSKVLGSNLTSNVDPRANNFSSGWMNLNLDPNGDRNLRASAELISLTGLPTTGFLAVNYINSNQAPGVLSNYSALYRHRASRECVAVTAGGVRTGACS